MTFTAAGCSPAGLPCRLLAMSISQHIRSFFWDASTSGAAGLGGRAARGWAIAVDPRIALPGAGSACEPIAHGGYALGVCEMLTMLPEGSRNAQSRGPQDWSMDSYSTSAPEARTFSKVASRSSVQKTVIGGTPLVSSSCHAASGAYSPSGRLCSGNDIMAETARCDSHRHSCLVLS